MRLLLPLFAVMLVVSCSDNSGMEEGFGNGRFGEVILNGEVRNTDGEPIEGVTVRAYAHFEEECEEGDEDPVLFTAPQEEGGMLPDSDEDGVITAANSADDGLTGRCIEIEATPSQGGYREKELIRNTEFRYLSPQNDDYEGQEIVTVSFTLESLN